MSRDESSAGSCLFLFYHLLMGMDGRAKIHLDITGATHKRISRYYKTRDLKPKDMKQTLWSAKILVRGNWHPPAVLEERARDSGS
jgi:hypothetical protein